MSDHQPSTFPAILCNSSDSNCSATKRVSQYPLQGFDLAMFTFSCCLYDTRLQSPHFPIALTPVDTVPESPLSKDAPLQVVACSVICFSFLEDYSNSLVMKDPVEVCPLSRRVMLPGSTLIRSITDWHSLFPPSFTRTANSIPCG